VRLRHRPFPARTPPQPADRALEPPLVEGLEQIVGRDHLERFEGILVVGRYENDRRHLVDADPLDHAEAIAAGHLDIEEDHVRLQVPNGGHGLTGVPTLADDLHVGELGQHAAQEAPRDRLVIHHEGPQGV
jgi:hypothetical protein